MISILIIVRNGSVRQFVVDALQVRTDFQVAGIYESLDTFLAEPESRESPQVVLLDYNLQSAGLQTLKKLKRRLPTSDIVLFTFANKSDDLYKAFCAGASGYILQSDAVEDLIRSIENIMRGDMIILPSIAQRILDSHFSSRDYSLTEAEVRLMRAIVEGHAVPYVRDTLKVPAQIMQSQIKSIFRKLHHSTQPATASD
jgi:DNA-binding NarL/FixJ family response regulator